MYTHRVKNHVWSSAELTKDVVSNLGTMDWCLLSASRGGSWSWSWQVGVGTGDWGETVLLLVLLGDGKSLYGGAGTAAALALVGLSAPIPVWAAPASLRSRGVCSQGLLLNARSNGSCSLLCIPGVRCCCHIPVVLREVLRRRHGGRLLSHRTRKEISAMAASCHPQFHMSVFSLTFSNNTKNMWLTSETTHLFLAAKTRPRVTYCKALFPPDSNPYWSLLKSCVQFFHNCPHSNHGRQPIKH